MVSQPLDGDFKDYSPAVENTPFVLGRFPVVSAWCGLLIPSCWVKKCSVCSYVWVDEPSIRTWSPFSLSSGSVARLQVLVSQTRRMNLVDTKGRSELKVYYMKARTERKERKLSRGRGVLNELLYFMFFSLIKLPIWWIFSSLLCTVNDNQNDVFPCGSIIQRKQHHSFS